MSSDKDKILVEAAIAKYYSQDGDPVKLLEFLNTLNRSIESCFKFIYHSKSTFDVLCKTCGTEICSDCTDVRCIECDNTDCCKFCLILCNICYNDKCSACMKFCEECRKYYCRNDYSAGSGYCDICCNECSHQCIECNKCYTVKCIGSPTKCSYNCSNSRNLCSSHFKQCFTCKNNTCKECISNNICNNVCSRYYYCNKCAPIDICKCGIKYCKCCETSCSFCNTKYCSHCVKHCTNYCGKKICITCAKDKQICKACKKVICCNIPKCSCSTTTFCNKCNTSKFSQKPCSSCNKLLCGNCLNTSKSCNKCKNIYCKKCRSESKKIIYNENKNEYLCLKCNNSS